jgi:hypothetical protein
MRAHEFLSLMLARGAPCVKGREAKSKPASTAIFLTNIAQRDGERRAPAHAATGPGLQDRAAPSFGLSFFASRLSSRPAQGVFERREHRFTLRKRVKTKA